MKQQGTVFVLSCFSDNFYFILLHVFFEFVKMYIVTVEKKCSSWMCFWYIQSGDFQLPPVSIVYQNENLSR